MLHARAYQPGGSRRLTVLAARKKKASTDPSRTKLISSKYASAALSRLRALRNDITTSVVTNDCFGLRAGTLTIFNEAAGFRQFAFTSDAAKHDSFMDWLRSEIEKGVLESVDRAGNPANSVWQDVYVRAAYERGGSQALADVISLTPAAAPSLQASPAFFSTPVHASALEVLYTRNFEALKGITDAMSAAISRELTLGFTQGLPATQLAKRLSDQVEGIGFQRAKVLARTEVMHAHAEATLNVYEQMGITQVGVEPEVNVLTAGDAVVCKLCVDLAAAGPYTLQEARGLIPRHPNCFPGDALVTSVDRITGYSIRRYNGDLVVIRTASGKEITPTVNHPILTRRGWIAASELQIGDEVVSRRECDWMRDGMSNHQYMPATIQEITEALDASGKMTACPVPVTAEDFHHEPTEGEVCIVGTDRGLLCEFHAAHAQPLGKLSLQWRDVVQGLFFSFGTARKVFNSFFHTKRSLVGSSRLIDALLRCHFFPFHGLRFALIAQGNTSGKQPIPNQFTAYVPLFTQLIDRLTSLIGADNLLKRDRFSRSISNRDFSFEQSRQDTDTRDLELARQILDGYTGKIGFDNIVSIHRRPFTGHVYNLQTESEYYSINGLVVHNCRCRFLSAKPKELEKPLPELGSKASQALWEKAQTTQDLERLTERKWPHITAEFTGLSPEVMRRTMTTFERNATEWPDAAKQVIYLGSSPEYDWPAKHFAHAAYVPGNVDQRKLGLNPAWFGDEQKLSAMAKKAEDVLWHPTGTGSIEGIINHEFGHFVDNWLRTGEIRNKSLHPEGWVSASGTQEVRTAFQQWKERAYYEIKTSTAKEWQLSEYAKYNEAEAFAEAYAASRAGNTSSKYTRQMEYLLDAVKQAKPAIDPPTREAKRATIHWTDEFIQKLEEL